MSIVEPIKNAKSIIIKIENTVLDKDVYTSRLRLKYDQSYQVLSYGLFVVVLVYNDFQSHFNLLYFDRYAQELVLVKQKMIPCRVNMHSMNRNEIICMHVSRQATDRYIAFDYEFNQTAHFGQKTDPKRGFFIRDASLIGLSFTRIYLYFYNIKTQRHCVKILNRLNGLVEKIIDIDSNQKAKFNCVKLDSSFRLMIRCCHNKDTIRYFDSNGEFLFKIQHPFCFGKFKNFDQISDNFMSFNLSDEINGLVAFL